MITHRKNKWVSAWFCRHSGRLLKKNFRKCSLTRESVLPLFEANVPCVVVSNHSSWWDALLAFFLSYYVFKREMYGVMVEEQLRRYDIFRYAGVYSVDRDSNREARTFLRYTREVLDGRDRLLWIYPQGDLISNEQTPLVFKKGFAQIVTHLSKVHLLKIIASYDFWIESKPEVVVDVAPLETVVPQKGSPFVNGLTERVQAEMTSRLAEVRRIVRTRDVSGLKPLFVRDEGTHPVYEFYRRFRSAFLGQSYSRRHGKD